MRIFRSSLATPVKTFLYFSQNKSVGKYMQIMVMNKSFVYCKIYKIAYTYIKLGWVHRAKTVSMGI